jgi:DNA-binding response OmpR family regulator
MRVLLIENDPDISSFIKIGLEYHNFIVETESDGLPGEKLTFSRNYDVLILDPEIAGRLDLEFCKKIMNDRNMTPVLILTSIDCIEKLVTVLDCRREDYLIKPFIFDELLSRLNAIMR